MEIASFECSYALDPVGDSGQTIILSVDTSSKDDPMGPPMDTLTKKQCVAIRQALQAYSITNSDSWKIISPQVPSFGPFVVDFNDSVVILR